jgi:hypothetical protein
MPRAMRRTYGAHGVAIESDIPLPELVEGGGGERTITLTVSADAAPPRGEPVDYGRDARDDVLECARCDGGFRIEARGYGAFFISADGARIVAFEPIAPPATLRHLILDHLLPRALNLTGRDALHATAILSARGVVAFAGESGVGKSTLAARFVARGDSLVCDDCMIVSAARGRVTVTPSYPGLRLLPDDVARVPGVRSIASVSDGMEKQRIVTANTRADRGGDLAAVYVLGLAPTASCRRLEARDAFFALMRCVYCLDPSDLAIRQRQFDLVATIASRVPIARVEAPRGAVDRAGALVEDDLGALGLFGA